MNTWMWILGGAAALWYFGKKGTGAAAGAAASSTSSSSSTTTILGAPSPAAPQTQPQQAPIIIDDTPAPSNPLTASMTPAVPVTPEPTYTIQPVGPTVPIATNQPPVIPTSSAGSPQVIGGVTIWPQPVMPSLVADSTETPVTLQPDQTPTPTWAGGVHGLGRVRALRQVQGGWQA